MLADQILRELPHFLHPDRAWDRRSPRPTRRAGRGRHSRARMTAGDFLDPSLRNRLTFGPIMLAVLLGLLWLDHYVHKRTQRAQVVRENDERIRWSQWRSPYEMRGDP